MFAVNENFMHVINIDQDQEIFRIEVSLVVTESLRCVKVPEMQNHSDMRI